MDDWELLQAYLAGDGGAMEVLIRRHIGMVYGTAFRLAPGPDAEDVTQVVFLLLTQKGKRISKRESIAGWLHRATRLVAANARKVEGRRRRIQREASMEKHASAAADGGEQMEWSEYLDGALSRLKDSERAAVLLHHGEGRTFEETGKMLGITAEASRKRAERGLRKLQAFFVARGMMMPGVGAGPIAMGQVPEGTLAVTLAIAHGKASPAVVALAKGVGIGAGIGAVTATVGAAVLTGGLALGGYAAMHAQARAPEPAATVVAAVQAAPAKDDWALPDPATDGSLGDILRNPPTALKVRVVADESGEPVAAFKVNVIASQDGQNIAQWMYSNRDLTGGRFAQWCSGDFRAVVVQVSAEGRAMAETPVLVLGKGDAVFTVRLTKAPEVTGRILLPDGKPAADAEVHLWEKSTSLRFTNGKLALLGGKVPRGLTSAITDAAGLYTLPPRVGELHGIVIHDAGWAELKRDAQAADDRITLRAWGRVEGDVPAEAGARGRRNSVTLGRTPFEGTHYLMGGEFDVREFLENQNVVPDADGHFVFERVMDGNFELLMGSGVFSGGPALKVGEHRSVSLPVGGRTATVKLVPPAGSKGGDVPYEATIIRLEAGAGSSDPAGALTLNEKLVDQSGNPLFNFEHLVPGKYGVFAAADAGVGRAQFEVAADGGNHAGVKEIQLRVPHHLKAGERAPAVEAVSLDGKGWRLSDLRGRYVLLHLWNTSGSPEQAQSVEVLRSFYPMLKKIGGEMVSVCVDKDMDGAKAFLVRHREVDWPQVFVNIFEEGPGWEEFYDPGGVASEDVQWLIAPDGKVVMQFPGTRGEMIFEGGAAEYMTADGTPFTPGPLDGSQLLGDVLNKVLPRADGVAAVKRPELTAHPKLLPKVEGLALYPIMPETTSAEETVIVDDPDRLGQKLLILTKASRTAKDWESATLGGGGRVVGAADGRYVSLQFVLPHKDRQLYCYTEQVIMLDGKVVGKTGPRCVGTMKGEKETVSSLSAFLTAEGRAAFGGGAVSRPVGELP